MSEGYAEYVKFCTRIGVEPRPMRQTMLIEESAAEVFAIFYPIVVALADQIDELRKK